MRFNSHTEKKSLQNYQLQCCSFLFFSFKIGKAQVMGVRSSKREQHQSTVSLQVQATVQLKSLLNGYWPGNHKKSQYLDTMTVCRSHLQSTLVYDSLLFSCLWIHWISHLCNMTISFLDIHCMWVSHTAFFLLSWVHVIGAATVNLLDSLRKLDGLWGQDRSVSLIISAWQGQTCSWNIATAKTSD